MIHYRITIETLGDPRTVEPTVVKGEAPVVAAVMRAFSNQIDPPKPPTPTKPTCRTSAVRGVEEGMS